MPQRPRSKGLECLLEFLSFIALKLIKADERQSIGVLDIGVINLHEVHSVAEHYVWPEVAFEKIESLVGDLLM